MLSWGSQSGMGLRAKVRVSALFLLEAPGENPCPCLLHPVEAICIPWLVALLHLFHSFCSLLFLLLHPQNQQWLIKAFSHLIPLMLTLPHFLIPSPPDSTSEQSCDHIVPTQIIQDNLSISRSAASVQFSRSVVSDSLRPHESQHARPPCPSPTPGVHSNSHPSSRWYHPAISSSVVPFSSCP